MYVTTHERLTTHKENHDAHLVFLLGRCLQLVVDYLILLSNSAAGGEVGAT